MEKLKKKGAGKSVKVSNNDELEKLRLENQKLKKQLDGQNAVIINVTEQIEEMKVLMVKDMIKMAIMNVETEELVLKMKLEISSLKD